MTTQNNLKSNQGQQGPELHLAFEELNENEQQLVCFIGQEGRPVFTIKEMMEGLGWHLGRTGRARGNSRVRNTLRRLVRSRWVAHEDEIRDGRYRISIRGMNQLVKLAEAQNENAPSKPRKHKPTKKTTAAKTEPETTAAPPTETPAQTFVPAPAATEAAPETATAEEF